MMLVCMHLENTKCMIAPMLISWQKELPMPTS